jgi:hypothetical protein
MKFRGKYSLKSQLLKEAILKEGSTVWGGGWMGETAVTKEFGGTLKANHMNGSHAGARSSEDVNLPDYPGNEVKQLMQPSGIGSMETIIPLELSAAKMEEFKPGSQTAQFKRWAKRGGAWDEWQSGEYDKDTERSTPSGQLGDRAAVESSMSQFLEEHIFCVDTTGDTITIYYFHNAEPARMHGMRPYNTKDRPAAQVVLDLNGATLTKSVTKADLKAWLTSQGVVVPPNVL